MLVSAFATLNTCSSVPPLNHKVKAGPQHGGKVLGVQVEQDISAFIVAEVDTRWSAQPKTLEQLGGGHRPR
jgi:hypothetical protein